MTVFVDFFKVLRDSGLLNPAFIIGAVALFVAILGNIKAVVELSPSRTLLLGSFGISLMILSVGGYFVSFQVSMDASTKGEASLATAIPLPPSGSALQPIIQPSGNSSLSSMTPVPTLATHPVIYNCSLYQETGKGQSLAMAINVSSGEIAFVDAFGFDNQTGGVFVTITGPYSKNQTIIDGAFCGGIKADANYAPLQEQRVRQCASCRKINLP